MNQINNWLDVFMNSTAGALQAVMEFVPKFIGAIVLLFLGWLVAKLVQNIANKLFDLIGINKLSRKAGVEQFLVFSGFASNLSWLFARIFFWGVILIFLLPISDILGIKFFGELVNQAIAYFPNIIVALIVILVGSWAAKVLSGMMRGSATRIGLEYSETLGTIVNITVLVVTFIIALSQLKIDATILGYILLILVASIAVAFSISFGLGAKGIIGNVLAGVYLSRSVKPGSIIKSKDLKGKLINIGTVYSTIELENKEEVKVSNSALLQN